MVRIPIHPGEILADELKELEMTAAELARILRVPTNRITQIISGKRAITADTALRLGKWLGTGPELWLNLQQSYELRLAQQTLEEEIANIPRRVTKRSAPSSVQQ
jgi:antitoxin HigA-1